ncbi:Transcriptional regulatory protein DegU [Corynebacterium provencense]|uniref:Transcriptional regulatory protein DegU n=1 Tax=Corynebacterium provencense TaxID=1737425 RepID=A0A2Z3YP36_9CORY|nr:response regulator transcription factor [Corynebacterium provencense]AWT27205.1 Transcriptional regulatory protein DegU [Corynebacterium provencense]
MISVLVVDDQVLIRQAVSDILSSHPDIEVVGTAGDGEEAVDQVASLHPDVVLMDIRMPVLDGIGATERICSDPANTGTRVLILTTFEEDEYVVSALRAGAGGFIGKGAEPEDIIRAVQAVHAGDSLLSPAATRGLITRYLDAPGTGTSSGTPGAPGAVSQAATRALERLTEREQEVLLRVGQGLSNQEIAEEFFISPHTAKTHVNRIMSKINAHDRAQLVILAYESGLLVPGD